jgi:hypothetical protein
MRLFSLFPLWHKFKLHKENINNIRDIIVANAYFSFFKANLNNLFKINTCIINPIFKTKLYQNKYFNINIGILFIIIDNNKNRTLIIINKTFLEKVNL